MTVFVRTKQATEEAAKKLCTRGCSATAINGDTPQGQYEWTTIALREGAIDILTRADVFACRLDVERISHVLSYDIPCDTEFYVHRIRLTGRAGHLGKTLLFVSLRELYLFKSIEKATRQALTEVELPTVEHAHAQRIAKFSDYITDALGGPGIELFHRLVEDDERECNVPMVDIAAVCACVP